VERHVREMLAEKISGTLVGLWLLLPEHLRLGTWDLLTAWTGVGNPNATEARLGLQMVHESALCISGVRQRRSLRQKGFETLNGLPFVATDKSIHELLDKHTVAESESLQLALGQLRQSQGHYPGKLILIDPHRIKTWSKRQMTLKKANFSAKAGKMLQTFFAIDADSAQPFGFTVGSSSVTVSRATPPLVDRLATILPDEAIILADVEHFTFELLKYLTIHKKFSMLLPMPQRKRVLQEISTMSFKPMWAGYAVAEGDYQLPSQHQTVRQIVQRTGETEDSYVYKPFLTTSQMPASDLMTLIFPERWNIEEFFNTESALGWNRTDINNWTAESMARKLFNGIDGDLRVKDDTIIVTLYNAPEARILSKYYLNLPQKLESEGVNPRVPWLYNFKVDFRFK
jgi:hypothetical protein